MSDAVAMYLQMGMTYQQTGRIREAEAAFQTALDKESDNAQALWGVAQLQLQKQQYEDAREHLEKLIEMDRAPGASRGGPAVDQPESSEDRLNQEHPARNR